MPSITVARLPAPFSAAHYLHGAVRPGGNRSRNASEQKALEPITQAGGAQANAVCAPLFCKANQVIFGLAHSNHSLGPETFRAQSPGGVVGKSLCVLPIFSFAIRDCLTECRDQLTGQRRLEWLVHHNSAKFAPVRP